MPSYTIPTIPTRGHWGEWIIYIGKVIVQKLRDSNLKYISVIPDDQVIYGFTEEPLNYPNIYVFPLQEPGATPTTSGDIIFSKFVFSILIEGLGPDLTDTDDQLRLILGDILAEILKDRTLTYNGSPTCSDSYLNILDVEYFPPEESDNIRRWHRIELVVEKQLDMTTVTV